jgi:hypothetical protein
MDDFPPIDPALVDHLDRLFPERTPDLSTPIDRIREMGGERKVIRFLRRKLEEQEEADITSTKVT